MPELGVVGGETYGFIVVLMRHIEVLLVEVNISSVEVEEGVFRIPADGIVVVLFGFFVLADMVESQTLVVVVETMRFILHDNLWFRLNTWIALVNSFKASSKSSFSKYDKPKLLWALAFSPFNSTAFFRSSIDASSLPKRLRQIPLLKRT